MHSLRIALLVGGAIITVFSLIPLIRSDYWAFRVFEYPRLQKLFLNLTIIITYTSLFGVTETADIVFLVLISANAAYLVYQIYPFTMLAKKVVLKAERTDAGNRFTIVSSNVLQYNRNAAGCLKMLQKSNPDVILLLETDEVWEENTRVLREKYPHQVLIPQPNTYGMLLYSRLELIGTETRFLVDEEIPSIKTKLKLPSGTLVDLYCVHPTPPVPGENDHSTERDKELLMVAKEIKESGRASIVVGDLNDVAWSYTTELFAKISGMLDPRIGRGFYNTFHAKLPFLRFPLDHVFCSTDFKLVELARLENFSSDHFPILISLQYEQQAHMQQPEPEVEQEDIELAEEKINKEVPA